jgi:release factor glutamine methyltransferase
VTIREALAGATHRLREAGIEDGGLEAEVLLRHALAPPGVAPAAGPNELRGYESVVLDRTAFLKALPEPLSVEADEQFQTVLARRLSHEPTAYITGRREFYGFELEVTPAVLIPRPETELLVEATIELARARGGAQGKVAIADVGTGSGAVAIALAKNLAGARLYACDSAADALAVAGRNAGRNSVADRICFLQGDLLGPLPEAVDIIVANLPYVATADWRELAQEVRDFEPRAALDGGADGLDFIRWLLAGTTPHLRPGGAVALEIGAGQGEAVAALARSRFPVAKLTVRRDLAGHERVVTLSTA